MSPLARKAPPCDGSCSGADPARRDATLAFAPAPVAWRPRPRELKPFVCDFDLPAGARVNALSYPMSPAAFHEKLFASWKTDEGEPLVVAAPRPFKANGVDIDLFEIAGTYTASGEPEPDHKHLVAYVHAPGGAWTIRLAGPRAGVDASRSEFLDWLETVRVVPLA